MSGKLSLSTRLLIIVLLICCNRIYAEETISERKADLFDMSIEQLMEVEISSTAALTESKPRKVPAAVTTITEDQIQASGARSLFELLDIYVPNLQWIRHHWESDHMGLRGIISDRDDKYLLLVNGRIMNERTHFGAVSERDLVLLRDIHHIDVVRGPGSGLYGPGAVSMVINIITHNAETFQGTEVTSRLGAVEEFYSTEMRHGQKFEEGGGLFLYGGIGKYNGADKHDAPQIYGFDFPEGPFYDWDDAYVPSDGTKAGEPIMNPSPNNDGEAHRGLPPIKVHAEITKGNWDIWARYTRGGKQFTSAAGSIVRTPWGWGNWIDQPQPPNSSGYQQATGYIGYDKQLTEQTNLDLAFSYDMFDFERYAQGSVLDAFREDEYYGKAMLKHDLNERHKIAAGFEVSHEEFGFSSPGWPHEEDPVNGSFSGAGLTMPRWSTNLYSIVGEHQWTINDCLTSFIGARVDDHTYTDRMFSPRAALVYTPTQKDTYKLMWARSVRSNFAEEMRVQAMTSGGNSRPEKLDSIELRYESNQSKNLDLAASAFFHYNLELISWSQVDSASKYVGTQKEWGLELEALYHTGKTQLAFSHGFTKLYDFDLEPGRSTETTVEPYGKGDDLANWSNHITKIIARYLLDEQWTLDGSLRIYWGFPGAKDYADYHASTTDYPLVESGWEKGYRGNYYLNLGLQYKPDKNLTYRVDGFNLLGIFDKDLNKRNYYSSRSADYRSHAASVAVSMIYRF